MRNPLNIRFRLLLTNQFVNRDMGRGSNAAAGRGGYTVCSQLREKSTLRQDTPGMAKSRKSSPSGARRGRTAAVAEPLGSRDEILKVALEEFAEHGLSGSRVDEIADRTRTSKRMIYYHFKSKEGLYRAVLEKAYSDIRSLDSQSDLQSMPPLEAMQHIVEITFDYDANHPQFVRLVSVENIHQASSLARLPSIRKRNASIIEVLTQILERGRASGVFRDDVNALDLHLMISSLCAFRVANRHTFGAIFNCNLLDPVVRRSHRKQVVDMVLRFLAAPGKSA
jgi:AcrR family transcriptional regulator